MMVDDEEGIILMNNNNNNNKHINHRRSNNNINKRPRSLAQLLGCCCAGTSHLLRSVFKDLRLLSLIMVVWLAIVILVMIEIGVFNNSTFVSWGPRPTLSFLHVPIDTSYKYGLLLVMIMVHTFVSGASNIIIFFVRMMRLTNINNNTRADFISDGLVPHLLNQLQDVRCKRLPHRHLVYYIVTTVYGLYAAVSQLFLIFLALGQLDLLLARLASDLAANLVTTHLYLETKTYDPLLSRRLNEDHLDDDDDSLMMMTMRGEGSCADIFDSGGGCAAAAAAAAATTVVAATHHHNVHMENAVNLTDSLTAEDEDATPSPSSSFSSSRPKPILDN